MDIRTMAGRRRRAPVQSASALRQQPKPCLQAKAQARFVLGTADATVSIAQERSARRRAFGGANPVASVHLC
jgi:hypothetical protein